MHIVNKINDAFTKRDFVKDCVKVKKAAMGYRGFFIAIFFCYSCLRMSFSFAFFLHSGSYPSTSAI